MASQRYKYGYYKGEPVVGYDAGLGVYVTKSGKNVTAAQYEAWNGKGTAVKPVIVSPSAPVKKYPGGKGFTGTAKKQPPQPKDYPLPANIGLVAAALKKNPNLFSAGAGGYIPPATSASTRGPSASTGIDWSEALGAGAPGASGVPEVDLSFLDTIDPNVNRVLPVKLAQGGARMLPRSAAERMAGLQFDPQIQDLQIEQLRTDRQNAQNLTDIGNWYQQVLGGLRTAATRDAAINRAAGRSTTEGTANIVSALGGAANQGSALVGAAGAEAAGTLAALGVAQEQYNADLAPLLQAESAGARSREAALGSARAHDLATRLAQARGQRGQAQAAAELDIRQANNQILDNRLQREIAIRQANNAARQANFGNLFGVGTTKLSTQISGINAATSRAGAEAGLINAKASAIRAITAAEKARKEAKGKNAFVPFNKATTQDLDRAYSSVYGILAEAQAKNLSRDQAIVAAGKWLVQNPGWKWSSAQGIVYKALQALEWGVES